MRLVLPLMLVIGALSGCEAAVRGEPLDPGRDFAELVISSTLERERVRGLLADPNPSIQARNEIILARMAEIDILYFQYEGDLTRELRESGFLLSLVGLGVGGAGAFVTEGASQILSAVSAGLTGAREAFDSEMLVEQTIQAFQAQMRARRSEVRAEILRKLTVTPARYPLQAAIADLAAYRQAGTLTEALIGVSDDAQVSAREAAIEVNQAEAALLDFEYNETPAGTRLARYLEQPGIAAAELQRRSRILHMLVEGQRARGRTECAADPDVLIYAPPAGCLALQSRLVDLLVVMGEIDA